MLNAQEDFEIKYWAGDNNFSYDTPKPKRSIKKRLFIVFSFVLMIAAAPIIFFSFLNLDLNKTEKINVVQTPVQEKQNSETVNQKKEIQQELGPKETKVLNNDSYWKISKRVCGEGKYYLSVRDQNKGKALYEGDTVSVFCQ